MKFEIDNWKYLNPVKIRCNTLFKNTFYGISDTCLFTSSAYGGPLAIAAPNTSYWDVTIRTSAGKILSTFKVHNLHSMYWTRCQRLVVVNSRGRVLVYTPLGKLRYQFLIDEEITVVETRVFYGGTGNTGLAVLLENNRIYAVNSVMEAVPWRISDITKANRPSTWNVLASVQITVLIIIGDAFYAGMQGVAPRFLNLPWKIEGNEYINIVPNWDYSRTALLHSSFIIQIIDSDFSLISTISLTTSGDLFASSSLTWCGNEVLAFKRASRFLHLISLCSETHMYDFGSPMAVDMELDGIKVFAVNELILLSQVPDVVDNVLGVASSEPGAILYEASEKLAEGTYGVYEYMHMIEDQMDKAVQQCLMAAAHQFDTVLQKKMLRAAALGKSVLRRQDTSQFVDICRLIRVLNALRRPDVGVMLTFAQSEELKMRSLIDRLTDLGQWPVAISICQYMRVPLEDGVHRVLAHWALKKIEIAKAEKESGRTPDFKFLSGKIVDKFTDYPEVSFADVAMKAADANLNELAELLLDKEILLNRQVEMLIKLNKIDRALAKAARSQQPDLLHFVLTHLKRTQKREVTDHIVLKLPQALCLYEDYLKVEAPRHLLALYVQKDDFARQSLYFLKESQSMAWNPFDNKDKIEGLVKAEKSLNKLKEQTAAQLVAETAELLRICEVLDGKPDFNDVERTSVRSVYIWAVGHGEDDLAEHLRKNFKLSEKACYLWKVESYAQNKLWHHLESLFKSKKVLTSYMPFIEACVKYGNVELCRSFVEKLTDSTEIIESLLLLRKPIEAANYAADKKLYGMLEKIHLRYRADKEIAQVLTRILNTVKKA